MMAEMTWNLRWRDVLYIGIILIAGAGVLMMASMALNLSMALFKFGLTIWCVSAPIIYIKTISEMSKNDKKDVSRTTKT